MARDSVKSKRGTRFWIITIAVALALAIGAYTVTGVIRGPEVHPGTPPPAAAALTPDEKAYYDYVAPRMHELIAELRLLAQLGGEKSRNIIVLERHYSRASSLISEIQTYQTQHPLPARFAPAATPLANGFGQVNAAMSDAVSAIFNLQFSKLGEVVGQFNKGAGAVNEAVTLLDQLGGGTPAAVNSATP